MSREAELGYRIIAKNQKRKILGEFIYGAMFDIENTVGKLRDSTSEEERYNLTADIENKAAGVRVFLEELT